MVLTAYLLVALVTLLPVARRYDDVPAARTWRFVAVAPLLSPLTSLAVLVVLAVLAVTFTYVTVLRAAGRAQPAAAGHRLARRPAADDARRPRRVRLSRTVACSGASAGRLLAQRRLARR